MILEAGMILQATQHHDAFQTVFNIKGEIHIEPVKHEMLQKVSSWAGQMLPCAPKGTTSWINQKIWSISYRTETSLWGMRRRRMVWEQSCTGTDVGPWLEERG